MRIWATWGLYSTNRLAAATSGSAEPVVSGEQGRGFGHFRPTPGDHRPVELGEVRVDRRRVGGDLENGKDALDDLATERRVQLGTSAWVGLGSDRLHLGVLGHRGQLVVSGDRVLDQLDNQLTLVSEHRVDGLHGDAGFLGDRADAGRAVARAMKSRCAASRIARRVALACSARLGDT